MKVGPFWKKLSIPTHSADGSFVIAVLHADSGSFQVWRHIFLIDRGDTCLNKIIKKWWLRFKSDILIYCSIENVVQHELFPGHFWTLLHTSNYDRRQVLNGGSSDLVQSKYGCECKLQKTLVKSLKICLREFFWSILIYKVCSMWLSDQDSKDSLLHSISPRKPVSYTTYFFYNNHVTIRIQRIRIIANV